MKLFALSIASLISLPSFVSAVSVPNLASRNATLIKRGGEVNYLSNCWRRYNAVSQIDDYRASYASYYVNQDNLKNGQAPDAISNKYRDWDRHGDWLIWEGKQYNLYYHASGVTVQFNINADAQSGEVGSYAGYAIRLSDQKWFNCHKDNRRDLYTKWPPVPDGTDRRIECNATYWCN